MTEEKAGGLEGAFSLLLSLSKDKKIIGDPLFRREKETDRGSLKSTRAKPEQRAWD